ncbi:hypothetical protein CEXT_239901 [Caerostris extrusa]|uniref:Uncharacterized protein n=1 Tax=Caerostris extrusa TaxID=172846 RepID=A0AAV4XKP6_CAEEX|nr:hypothetical protein CEXT_239901 [Caerostris extrusa]
MRINTFNENRELLLSVTVNQTLYSQFSLIQTFEFWYSNIVCSLKPFLDFHIHKGKQTSSLSCKYRHCKGNFSSWNSTCLGMSFDNTTELLPEERLIRHTSVCRAGYRFCGI